MAQRAIDLSSTRPSSPTALQAAPSLGLRGGLGKTLLIAFLLLAIVPLSLLAFFTYNQIQRDTAQKLGASLERTVAQKEAHLADWIASYEHELTLLANDLDWQTEASDSALSVRLAALQRADPAVIGLVLVDQGSGDVWIAGDSVRLDRQAVQELLADGRLLHIVPGDTGEGSSLLAVSYNAAEQQLVGLLSWDSLQQIVTASGGQGKGISTRLVTADGLVVSAQGLTRLSTEGQEASTQGILQALDGRNGAGAYTNLEGIPVFGAYRWNPELQVALVAEQAQTEALAAGDTLAAVVIAATLAVALITAAIAAVVTRRVTSPIVQLTETAAWMARGDLNQEVTVTRRDEIGVLARAFNRMAAELRVLYEQLEAKVAERTQQLEEANRQTRYHLTQLATSAEVARVATSIRELDTMLSTVVELLGQAFELHHAAIYLLDGRGEWAVRQVGSNGLDPLPLRVQVGGPTLVGRVAADGARRVIGAGSSTNLDALPTTELCPPVACELAVPLRVRDRILGVLDLQSARADDFDENDQVLYQSLSDQISITIENARAYALERETVQRLRELDRIQSQFLTNMSHALRTPLNSIIGFSRVMLKEMDGPLSDLQRTDLDTIHQSGRQLLGLINDMLDLSQLELGTAPFSVTEVDLAEIIEGVMATARALARGKPVQLYEDVPEDTPLLHTDGQRVRQVILALLSNAVKFTDKGSIYLRVQPDDGHVTISVSDTGVGIPPAKRARLFAEALQDGEGEEKDRPGFGLAISKRVIERLGGQIWVESKKGLGSTFTFTLPVEPVEGNSAPDEK